MKQTRERWYDIQDEQGIWRVGECLEEDEEGKKTIAPDGFHPNFTNIYCQHSTQIQPVRSKTYGLTTPQNQYPLREVLNSLQMQNVPIEKDIQFSGLLNLFIMKQNSLEFQSKRIRTTIRTQLLIFVDKIITTPFQIIREIKMMELETMNFFINILRFYIKIIQYSKVFMPVSENNQVAHQLYKSIYQLTLMANLIFGFHPHSNKLYDHNLNVTLKSMMFIDFFVKSDMIAFRYYFKGACSIKKLTQFDYQIFEIVTNLFLDLCQKTKNVLLEGQYLSKTNLILDQIIINFKHIIDFNQDLKNKMNKNLSLISKIQSLYIKIKPNKVCPIRKFFIKQQIPKISIQPIITNPTSTQKPIPNQQFQKLVQKIKKIQTIITNQYKTPTIPTDTINVNHQKTPNLPIQNLGQQMFLGSLQFALETGDIQKAKKLTKWRRSLLQVGRITGWEVALAIGLRTYQKQEITAADIIQANYQYLAKINKST